MAFRDGLAFALEFSLNKRALFRTPTSLSGLHYYRVVDMLINERPTRAECGPGGGKSAGDQCTEHAAHDQFWILAKCILLRFVSSGAAPGMGHGNRALETPRCFL
jgi:hypothetical protein